MLERDTISWNSLIFGYSGIGKLDIAQKIFDSMPTRDVVSWNTIISCYLQSGNHKKCEDIFLQMVKHRFCFDHTTLAVVLKCCSFLEDFILGIQIHGHALKMGFNSDMVT